MDALQLLREQHAEVERALDALDDAGRDERPRLAGALVDGVNRHLVVEERHLRPVLRELSLAKELAANDAAHARLRRAVAALAASGDDAAGERAALARVRAELQAHRDAQEAALFGRVAALVSHGVLRALATAMMETIAEMENDDWLGAPVGEQAAW